MRKALTTVLVGALLLIPTQASAVNRPCSFPRTVAGNDKTILCFARLMHVSGQQAEYIADRESHDNEWAWNNYSGAAGLFQHLIKYWPSRVHTFRRALTKYHVKYRVWHNPRAQAVVTFKMVQNQGGWCPAWC